MPHFVLLSEESGRRFVETADLFADDGDLALQRNLVSLGRDGAVLQSVVT